MMKKKVMPLSCLMAAAMLAGCGTAAPAVPEETTAPAVETAEAAQETAPADAAESEAAAVEKTAGVWQVEPCYNFDEIVPLYSEWDHTAGKNAADGLYAVRDGERWSLFSTKTVSPPSLPWRRRMLATGSPTPAPTTAALPWTAPSAFMDTSITTAPNPPTTSSRPPARSSTNNLSGSRTSNPMDLRY